MKRRDFVQAAIGIGAISIGQWSPASLLSVQDKLHFIIDVRLMDIDLLSQCHSLDRAVVHEIAGNIVPLWQNTLATVWKDSVSPIIGITRHSEYFVLGELARDVGYVMTEATEQKNEISWIMNPLRKGNRGNKNSYRI